MSFYDRLQAETSAGRAWLQGRPLIRHALAGELGVATYVAFLAQAYHHVRHTVPLLMAAGSRVPAGREWLRDALVTYIEEERGHEEWVLNDIAACGYDAGAVRCSPPAAATELMVAYAYHVIDRVNPVGFLGMVHVLEGTSVALADRAAQAIADTTGLPPEAFTYLRSHGALDVGHVEFFAGLMDRVEDPGEQHLVVHCAGMFYKLYGDIFNSIEPVRSKDSEWLRHG